MEFQEVMRELEAQGTAQNRKVYGRHGVGENCFGVSYANLGKLQKRIKTDHDLAVKLWASGNHDARVLATMVADPAQADGKTLEAWAKELDNYVLTDALSGVVARSPVCRSKMEKWTRSTNEWIGSAGWNVLSYMVGGATDLPDEYFAEYVDRIEARIHGSKNRVRHAMNQSLISLGLLSPGLEKRVVAAARRIGKVVVDHGETSCKTPDAIQYIEKTKAYRKTKATKKKTAKKAAKKKTAKRKTAEKTAAAKRE